MPLGTKLFKAEPKFEPYFTSQVGFPDKGFRHFHFNYRRSTFVGKEPCLPMSGIVGGPVRIGILDSSRRKSFGAIDASRFLVIRVRAISQDRFGPLPCGPMP